MPRQKPLRPGNDCPSCGGLLVPHCPEKGFWPRGCAWVKCARCASYGTSDRWARKPEPTEEPKEPDAEDQGEESR